MPLYSRQHCTTLLNIRGAVPGVLRHREYNNWMRDKHSLRELPIPCKDREGNKGRKTEKGKRILYSLLLLASLLRRLRHYRGQ